MDDITNKRFDSIERRFEELPRAMAKAFGEAFADARAELVRDLNAHADSHHRELLAELRGNHRELIGKLTEMFTAVPTRAEVRDDDRFARLNVALEELRAEVADLRRRIG